ncbi:MAG TPA: FAD-dependent oxidoreductase, partial [Armatimonadota bacterium]|nr:FAD-dependent oxidoreductase [Armatimonadota bacterium]
PGLDKTTVENCGPGFRYQIPYRILVPRDVDNLLTAGRCVSVTHLALGSIRVMAQCMVTGQAAGVAAARSLQEGTTPRQVNVAALQAALRRDNCILTENDIIREETVIA